LWQGQEKKSKQKFLEKIKFNENHRQRCDFEKSPFSTHSIKYRYFKPNEPRPMNSMNSNSGVLKRYSGLTYIPGISDKIAKKFTDVNESLIRKFLICIRRQNPN
jgi:hypothetical protein